MCVFICVCISHETRKGRQNHIVSGNSMGNGIHGVMKQEEGFTGNQESAGRGRDGEEGNQSQ